MRDIHHGFYEVFIPVADIDRAVAFYEKLGFNVAWKNATPGVKDPDGLA